MAISNTASRNTYTLDSVTTDFDITFDCVFDDNGDATELTVWLIDSEGNRTEIEKGYASDQYTVAYKTVTYLDATAHAGETLLISRATPRTQLTDFINNGAYNLNQVEAMSDKLTRIVQEQDDTIEDRIQTGESYAESAKESAEAALASEQNAKTSEDNAKDSEAYAIGTRGGNPVSSDDPAYHNNSKWYNDNIAQQTVTPDNAVALTNKTIAYADNTLTGVQPTLTAGTGIDITGTTISTKQTQYLDIVTVSKTVSINANTDASVDFTTEITAAGVDTSKVRGGFVIGYAPSTAWQTQLIVRGRNGKTKLNVRTNGSTNQSYTILAEFFYWHSV